jgi:hypothetical protein
MLYCKKCDLEKDKDYFWKNSSLKRGYSYTCKDCMNLYYKARSKENYNKWARNYRLKEQNKDYERNFRTSYLQSFNGFVSKLWSTSKNRAKVKDWEFDLTKEWISEKLNKMVCEVTGCSLTLLKYNKDKYHSNPFNPSIDRIDSTKGYIMENCRLVCWIYNIAKSDFTDKEVYLMSKNLILNGKESIARP